MRLTVTALPLLRGDEDDAVGTTRAVYGGGRHVLQHLHTLDIVGVDGDQRIKAAGCILPVSHDLDIPKELGLRHRAALGISQESDCVAVVVSEETGSITVAIKSELQIRLSAEKLESILTKEMM